MANLPGTWTCFLSDMSSPSHHGMTKRACKLSDMPSRELYDPIKTIETFEGAIKRSKRDYELPNKDKEWLDW